MREEVISSGGNVDPTPAPTPAASSVGASSPAVPLNFGSIEGSSHGQLSKAASLSYAGSQPPRTSLSTSAGDSAFGSSRPSCRPWERGDLLSRLATFKPLNWLGKPKIISSIACAQRGWVNVDVDKISCESCGASFSFASSSSRASGEGESFAKQLDVGHKVNCPWRGNRCPESLVQFPPTPQSALVGGYKDRCDGLVQFEYLPVVSVSAVERMRISRGPQIDRFLSLSHNLLSGELDFKPETSLELEIPRDEEYYLYSCAQKLISLCGWEPRWLLNVQDFEEHSAQSTRKGYFIGPTQTQIRHSQDQGRSWKAVSGSAKKDYGKKKMVLESPRESRSPLLDCSLCGATIRVMDFSIVPRPARFAPNNTIIPDTSKKLGLTRGASAASGISGWVPVDENSKEQTEDRDEVTTNDGKSFRSTEVDLNLTMGGRFSFTQLGRTATSRNINDGDMGRDLMIGQPSGSEVGDRAASYESHGPSSRKRNLEKGASSSERPILMLQQQADSVEGTVIDRDGEEVTDCRQFSEGPSKRARDSDVFDAPCSPYQIESSGAGPSHAAGFEIYSDYNHVASLQQENFHMMGIQSTRDSMRASSVVAMDTICHSANDDSMESVENRPGDLDDVHFPSYSVHANELSGLNNSNQAQQSICPQTATEVAPGEMGISSTWDGEEFFHAETFPAQAQDGVSFGVSAGSVGICASHEAEMHGTDASNHRAESVVGDVEPRLEDGENQGLTGESTLDPGMMDEIVPYEMNRDNLKEDSQEILSRSAGRADSGSKIDGSTKAESVESGKKIRQGNKQTLVCSADPYRSCEAILYSGYGTTKKEVMKDGKSSFANDFAYQLANEIVFGGLFGDESEDYMSLASVGPTKGESNYEEAAEFDPIVHHNQFCPWVNGTVAAAGCATTSSSANADSIALSGWQLALDALDALQSLGQIAIQTIESESAASMYKEDDQGPSQKLQRHNSVSRSHGQS